MVYNLSSHPSVERRENQLLQKVTYFSTESPEERQEVPSLLSGEQDRRIIVCSEGSQCKAAAREHDSDSAAGGVRVRDLSYSKSLYSELVTLEYQAGTRSLHQGTYGIKLPFRTVTLTITLAL